MVAIGHLREFACLPVTLNLRLFDSDHLAEFLENRDASHTHVKQLHIISTWRRYPCSWKLMQGQGTALACQGEPK